MNKILLLIGSMLMIGCTPDSSLSKIDCDDRVVIGYWSKINGYLESPYYEYIRPNGERVNILKTRCTYTTRYRTVPRTSNVNQYFKEEWK